MNIFRVFIVFLAMGMVHDYYACTSILVTKQAGVDHSVIVAHSDDNNYSDQRIIYVPASDHAAGAKRAIYPFG